jgi:hypothetical protein
MKRSHVLFLAAIVATVLLGVGCPTEAETEYVDKIVTVYPLGVSGVWARTTVGVTGVTATLTGVESLAAFSHDYSGGDNSRTIIVSYNGLEDTITLSTNIGSKAALISALTPFTNTGVTPSAGGDGTNFVVLTAAAAVDGAVISVSGTGAEEIFGAAPDAVTGAEEAIDEWTLTITGTASADGEAYVSLAGTTAAAIAITKADDADTIAAAIDGGTFAGYGTTAVLNNVVTFPADAPGDYASTIKPSITFLPLEDL